MGEIKTDKQELSAKKNIKKWEIILYVSILALYAAVNIYLMSCHEAWIDEAQAWVLAKQLSWTQIPGLCASEGHPVLWFYILKITILLGLPFRYFSVISIFFMTLALGVFLFRSDFNPVSKILVVLSPLFFYYNEPQAFDEAYEYLLGRDILVAPVLKQGATEREVYLPRERWIHLPSGKEYRGGRVLVNAPLGEIPVFVRAEAPQQVLEMTKDLF